jgi:hypothetical protein
MLVAYIIDAWRNSTQQLFQGFGEVGEKAELTWIYDAACHQYAIFKQSQDAINSVKNIEPTKPLVCPENYDDLVWIHAGDDLAFGVGGSSACGAKTILVELPKTLGQSAPCSPNVRPPPSKNWRLELE